MSLLAPHKDTHLRRSSQIAEVLARHRLGYLRKVFDLERFLPFQHSEQSTEVQASA